VALGQRRAINRACQLWQHLPPPRIAFVARGRFDAHPGIDRETATVGISGHVFGVTGFDMVTRAAKARRMRLRTSA